MKHFQAACCQQSVQLQPAKEQQSGKLEKTLKIPQPQENTSVLTEPLIQQIKSFHWINFTDREQ